MVREGEVVKLLHFRDRKQSVRKLCAIGTPPHSPPGRCKTTGSLEPASREDLFKGHRHSLPSPRLGFTQGVNTSQPSLCPLQ